MAKLAPALDAALTLAAHGLSCFPIKARSKEPATGHGFKDATRDGGILHRRFTAAGPDANLGVATGGGLIVVDLDGPEAEEWARTRDLPRTWTATTGRGRHLYYLVDRPVRTCPGLAPKVDIKGEGGYVLAPPSVHPSGAAYEWTAGGPATFPIVVAPPWLLALLDEPRPTRRAPAAIDEIVTVGQDDFGARRAASLAKQGFSRTEAKAALEQMIGTRFAGGWAGLDPSRPWQHEDIERWLDGGYAKFYDPGAPARAAADERLEAKVRAKGPVPTDAERRDRERPATDELDSAESAADVDVDIRTGWERADLGPAVRGEVLALPPRFLDRADGVCLLYPGKLHWLSGEPEGLKSWLAQIAVADALADGLTACYVDFEGDDLTIVDRLRALGVPDEAVLSRLGYHRPETPMSSAVVARLLADVEAMAPTITVIDGVNAAMGASNLDSNHATDFHRWWTTLGHRLQRLTSGPTIAIDHVVKNPENRGQYAAGTGQKLAAVDVHIGTIVIDAFGIGLNGRAKLILHKDRAGALRPQALGRQLGTLVLASDPATRAVKFNIEPARGEGDPNSPEVRPTGYMERVSRKLEGLIAGKTKADVKREIDGKDTYVLRAIDALVAGEYVASTPERNTSLLVSLKPYREDEDSRRVAAPLRQAGHNLPGRTVPDRSRDSGTVRVADQRTVPPLRGTVPGTVPMEQPDRSPVPDRSPEERTDLCATCGDVNWMRRRANWICASCGERAA